MLCDSESVLLSAVNCKLSKMKDQAVSKQICINKRLSGNFFGDEGKKKGDMRECSLLLK